MDEYKLKYKSDESMSDDFKTSTESVM